MIMKTSSGRYVSHCHAVVVNVHGTPPKGSFTGSRCTTPRKVRAAAPAVLTAAMRRVNHGTKWESNEICGPLINPLPCYLRYMPKHNLFFDSIGGPTPLTRARHHCNRFHYCEEILPNGKCMTVSSTVRGKRDAIAKPCADKATQLWQQTAFPDGTYSFEVFSLVHNSACTWRHKHFQYVLTAHGDGTRVNMEPPHGLSCTIPNSQLWVHAQPPPPASKH